MVSYNIFRIEKIKRKILNLEGEDLIFFCNWIGLVAYYCFTFKFQIGIIYLDMENKLYLKFKYL